MSGSLEPAPLLRVAHGARLVQGTLLGRRKRFLADVRLTDGRDVVAHCVNPGQMEGLVRPGARVWFSEAPVEGSRKLTHTWELVEHDGRLVGANTLAANRIARGLLEHGCLRGLARHDELRAERRYGENSRVDFWLREGNREHYVEVKNCHLVYPDGRAYFPDSPSERATRHLRELVDVVTGGQRATVLFVVQDPSARAVRPSDLHDPTFAEAARWAQAHGVRFRAVRVRPTRRAYAVDRCIPVDLAPYASARLQRFRVDNAPWSGSRW